MYIYIDTIHFNGGDKLAGYMVYLRSNIDAGLKDYMTGKPISVNLAINEIVERELRKEGFLVE